MTLVSSVGTEVELISTDLGGCEDVTSTVFDDSAAGSVTSGTCVGNASRGTFQPDAALSALVGKDANGTWHLNVDDAANGDEGTINGWWLTIR
jgi:hypothetical protein